MSPYINISEWSGEGRWQKYVGVEPLLLRWDTRGVLHLYRPVCLCVCGATKIASYSTEARLEPGYNVQV